MRRLIAGAALVLAAAFFAPQPGRAETVYLKSGAAVTGSVTDSTAESIELLTSSGTVRFARAEVARVEKDLFRVTVSGGKVYEGTIEDLTADSMVLMTAGGRVVIVRSGIVKAEQVMVEQASIAQLSVPVSSSAVQAAVSTGAAVTEISSQTAVSASAVAMPVAQQPAAEPVKPIPQTQITAETARAESEADDAVLENGRVRKKFLGRNINGQFELAVGPWLNSLELDLGPYGGTVVSPGKTGIALSAEYLFVFKSGFSLGAQGSILSLGTKTHNFAASSAKTSGGINMLQAVAGYEFHNASRVKPYIRAGAGVAFTGVNYNITDSSVIDAGHKAGTSGFMFSAAAGARTKIGGAWVGAELRYLHVKQKDNSLGGSPASFVPAAKVSWVF